MAIAVVGAGLAGSECAYILAEIYNQKVVLFEMKSIRPTPAQDAPHLFAELVCSNSLKSTSMLNPAGVLKKELLKLGSLVLRKAYEAEVPAGETLAVDRELFSGSITKTLRTHKNIEVREEIVTSLEPLLAHSEFECIVVATGPLTGDELGAELRNRTGSQSLYFYDAIAPIIDGSTINRDICFVANRETRTQSFEKRNKPVEELAAEEQGDYLNVPLTKDEYLKFVEALVAGPKVPFHDFEEPRFFNGCQPIEVLAESGPLTLAHGPMKGRGLTNPRTGRWPYAAVQLRKEKLGDDAYNMVGFQTRLTWGAQKELFKTLPGLENAEFFRMGSMHRNTYLVSPQILNQDFTLKAEPRCYLAGQVMGVEGYLESTAMGNFIGHMIGQRLLGNKEFTLPPANTSLGSLVRYCLFAPAEHFTPMNIHWGLFDELSASDLERLGTPPPQTKKQKLDKSTKRSLLSERARQAFDAWLKETAFGSFLMERGVRSL